MEITYNNIEQNGIRQTVNLSSVDETASRAPLINLWLQRTSQLSVPKYHVVFVKRLSLTVKMKLSFVRENVASGYTEAVPAYRHATTRRCLRATSPSFVSVAQTTNFGKNLHK